MIPSYVVDFTKRLFRNSKKISIVIGTTAAIVLLLGSRLTREAEAYVTYHYIGNPFNTDDCGFVCGDGCTCADGELRVSVTFDGIPPGGTGAPVQMVWLNASALGFTISCSGTQCGESQFNFVGNELGTWYVNLQRFIPDPFLSQEIETMCYYDLGSFFTLEGSNYASTWDSNGLYRGRSYTYGTCAGTWTTSSVNHHTLTVVKQGSGTGTITSRPSGVDCGVSCMADFDESTEVTLEAVLTDGNTGFAGWTGCDTSDGTVCTVSMTADKTVEASFNISPCSIADDIDGDGNPDNDGDGLCDRWETEGIDINNDGIIDLDLPAMGADPNHKDIFVEVDYMDCAVGGCAEGDAHSHRTQYTAIQDVINAFANASVSNPRWLNGITLHVIVDEAVREIEPILFVNNGSDSVDDFNDLKLGNPRNECGVGATDGHFGTRAERSSPNCENILEAKRRVFRYAIFGHNHAHTIGSSGIAELPGNDLMVTLGGWSASGIADCRWPTGS